MQQLCNFRDVRLAQQLVGLRRLALGQWVAPDLEGLGLQPLAARDPTMLLRRAELVAVRFEANNPGPMLGRPRGAQPPDLSRYVAEIKRVATALGGVVVEVHGARCELGEARSEKKAAMAAYDRIFLRAARLFEDLCRLAGKPELASRVRPSAAAPRSGTEQELADEHPDHVAAQGGDALPAADPVPAMPGRFSHALVLTAAEHSGSAPVLHRLNRPGSPRGRSPPRHGWARQAREASEALRSGDLEAASRFPAGSYPPALAFAGDRPPPPTRRITKSESGIVERDEIPAVTIQGRWSAAKPEEPRARGQPP